MIMNPEVVITMSISANDFVSWAQRQIGVAEKPLGSNNVKYNTKYYGSVVSGSGYAWCQAFIWCGFQELNAAKLFCDGGKSAYTVYVADWFNRRGKFYREGKTGDMIFFDWSGSKNINAIDHVGVVEKVLGNGQYQCIEGNTSNMVKRVVRSSCIVGFARPDYGKDTGNSATTSNNNNTFTVKSGDSLWAIAQKYKMTVADLKSLNKLSSDLIFVGQTLKVSGTASNSTTSYKQIAVDGEWGSDTTRRIQQILGGLTVDGILGPDTIRAIQKVVGTVVDGILGPNTIRAMQRYFGTVVDGVISKPSLMVKAMQTRLNQNKF